MNATLTIDGKSFTVLREREAGPNVRRELGASHTLTLEGARGAMYYAQRRASDGAIVNMRKLPALPGCTQ